MTNGIKQMIALGLAWPICVLAFTLVWPGPVPLPDIPSAVAASMQQAAGPPVDTTGSRQYISSEQAGSEMKVFWRIPEPGRVQAVIVIPPSDESAGAQEAPGPEPETN